MRRISLGVCTGVAASLALSVLADPALISPPRTPRLSPIVSASKAFCSPGTRVSSSRNSTVSQPSRSCSNPDGTLAASAMDVSTPRSALLTVSEEQFACFGVLSGDLRYIGASQVHLPLNTVLVALPDETRATSTGLWSSGTSQTRCGLVAP
jgi:hypothetical protein